MSTIMQSMADTQAALNALKAELAELRSTIAATTVLAATPGGTADAITLDLDVSLSSLPEGLELHWMAPQANTGATTIAVAGLAAVPAKTVTGDALPAGYIRTDLPTVGRVVGGEIVVYREPEVIGDVTDAGGRVTRFADGRQGAKVSKTGNFDGAPKLSADWTFAQPFVAAPVGGVAVTDMGGATPSVGEISEAMINNVTAASMTLDLYRDKQQSDFVSGDEATFHAVAWGDWYQRSS